MPGRSVLNIRQRAGNGGMELVEVAGNVLPVDGDRRFAADGQVLGAGLFTRESQTEMRAHPGELGALFGGDEVVDAVPEF